MFLPIPAPALYMSIDETDRHVVGMNPLSAAAMRDGILSRIFPGTAQISTDVTRGMEFVPNIEEVLALRPDVVFQWASAGSQALEPLDRAGLNVVGLRAGGQDALEEYVTIMGAVAGKRDRAADLVARLTARRADIDSTMRRLPEGSRPKVLYIGLYADQIRTAGRGTYYDFSIPLAGGRNVASGSAGMQTLNVEQILTWDPEIILLGNFDPVQPADIYADPRWQGLAAVKARKVYKMPLGGYRWDPPSQESALAWTWLAGLLQPTRFAVDLRADMRTWYRFLYDHDLDDAEIDRILFVAENAGSAGYERFRAR